MPVDGTRIVPDQTIDIINLEFEIGILVLNYKTFMLPQLNYLLFTQYIG
jgi:hypothetical protein